MFNSTPLHLKFFKISSSIDGYKFLLFYQFDHVLFIIVIYVLLVNLE